MSKLIRSIFVLLAATLTFSQVVAQTRSAAGVNYAGKVFGKHNRILTSVVAGLIGRPDRLDGVLGNSPAMQPAVENALDSGEGDGNA